MRHIVTIAGESQLESAQFAELLAQRQNIRQCLARMIKVAQRVNHRRRGPMRQLLNGGLRKRSRDDRLRPPLQVPRDVLQRLANAQRTFARDGVSAQLLDRQFKCKARAQRRLLKKQADILTAERARILGGRPLYLGGQVEQVQDLVVSEIEIAHQIGRRNLRNGPYRYRRGHEHPSTEFLFTLMNNYTFRGWASIVILGLPLLAQNPLILKQFHDAKWETPYDAWRASHPGAKCRPFDGTGFGADEQWCYRCAESAGAETYEWSFYAFDVAAPVCRLGQLRAWQSGPTMGETRRAVESALVGRYGPSDSSNAVGEWASGFWHDIQHFRDAQGEVYLYRRVQRGQPDAVELLGRS